jgi:hypothetical protein
MVDQLLRLFELAEPPTAKLRHEKAARMNRPDK